MLPSLASVPLPPLWKRRSSASTISTTNLGQLWIWKVQKVDLGLLRIGGWLPLLWCRSLPRILHPLLALGLHQFLLSVLPGLISPQSPTIAWLALWTLCLAIVWTSVSDLVEQRRSWSSGLVGVGKLDFGLVLRFKGQFQNLGPLPSYLGSRTPSTSSSGLLRLLALLVWILLLSSSGSFHPSRDLIQSLTPSPPLQRPRLCWSWDCSA